MFASVQEKPIVPTQSKNPSTSKLKLTYAYCSFLLGKFPDLKGGSNIFDLKKKIDLYLNKNVPVEKVSEIFLKAMKRSPSLIPMLIEGRDNPNNWRCYAVLLALEFSSETAELLMPSFLATLNTFSEREIKTVMRKAAQHSPQFVAPLLEKGVKANTDVLNIAAKCSPHLIPLLLENGAIPDILTLYLVIKHHEQMYDKLITELLIEQGISMEQIDVTTAKGMIDRENISNNNFIEQVFQQPISEMEGEKLH